RRGSPPLVVYWASPGGLAQRGDLHHHSKLPAARDQSSRIFDRRTPTIARNEEYGGEATAAQLLETAPVQSGKPVPAAVIRIESGGARLSGRCASDRAAPPEIHGLRRPASRLTLTLIQQAPMGWGQGWQRSAAARIWLKQPD